MGEWKFEFSSIFYANIGEISSLALKGPDSEVIAVDWAANSLSPNSALTILRTLADAIEKRNKEQ